MINSASCNTTRDVLTEENKGVQQNLTSQDQSGNSEIIPKYSQPAILSQEFNQQRQNKISNEKCYIYEQPHVIMNLPNVNNKLESYKNTNKVDRATLTARNSSSAETFISLRVLKKLQKKIENLERKILNQDMVLQSIDSNLPTSSSDEEIRENMGGNLVGHPGCSYIEQYSHVPETSAFQRYAQQTASVSAKKGTNLGKDHNSEQYGRDFTTYDGLTARGRRQSSSVPGKRDDIPKMAAERVHKIRHKLNPVRDYRLMDTVHYLAQGEFAPRDDGIKLTPSREAVLSDIIWEDVCRTHWPNARLARRQYNDRYSSRFELQRLIDNLLRERVAHVERRRRRHYRIVKLNHRHESCRPVGKTGDIIVASHKSRQSNEQNNDREMRTINKNVASAILANKKHDEWNSRANPGRSHKSNDRLTYPWLRRKKCKQNDCSPGPSTAVCQSTTSKNPTSCYQSSNLNKSVKITETAQGTYKTSESTLSKDKGNVKVPRLLVKKDSLRRKYSFKQKSNLEHFILLPTLVVRTPSNIKRQRKFNELYHRVLNVQTNNGINTLQRYIILLYYHKIFHVNFYFRAKQCFKS